MFCAIWLFGVPIGLLIGAVILRAAVPLANAVLDRSRIHLPDDEDDSHDEELDLQRLRSRRAIPRPSFGEAVLVVFLTGLLNFGLYMLIGLSTFAAVPGIDGRAVALSLSVPGGILVMSGLLKLLLPTRFGRACLVALLNYAMWLVIGGGLYLAILAIEGNQALGG